MNFIDVEKGKEFDFIPKEFITRLIVEFNKDVISYLSSVNKLPNNNIVGGTGVRNVDTINHGKKELWIEWNARIFDIKTKTFDIGIQRCIIYDPNNVPDIVFDRYNLFSKEYGNQK